jgi:hypothetical protein
MTIREVFHRLAVTGIFDVVVVKNLGIPANVPKVSHTVSHLQTRFARKEEPRR